MTAPAPAPVAAPSTGVIESQATALAGMSVQAQAAVAAYIAQVGRDGEIWYDAASVTDMAVNLAQLSNSFSVSAARYMDAFIADSISHLDGKAYRPTGVRNTTGLAGENGVRKGVTTAGVFGRAADTYRYQQSLLDKVYISDVEMEMDDPTELASPLDAAITRAKRAAQLNTALAGRNQAVVTMAEAARRGRVIGYRRVLHAELAHEGSCGLCIADSTRIYRSDHLLAMHPGCHCIPVPVAAGKDPGAAINDADLGRFYGDAHGTSAAKLRETRYKVDEHGEVGPVLRPLGEPIRKANEARRDTNRPRRPKTPAEQAVTLRRRRDALERAWKAAPTPTGPSPWRTRNAAVAARIDALDREIVKLHG